MDRESPLRPLCGAFNAGASGAVDGGEAGDPAGVDLPERREPGGAVVTRPHRLPPSPVFAKVFALDSKDF